MSWGGSLPDSQTCWQHFHTQQSQSTFRLGYWTLEPVLAMTRHGIFFSTADRQCSPHRFAAF